MKIIYFANHGNLGSDDTESHITYSLEKLGHEVIRVREKDPDLTLKHEANFLLFHKGGSYLSWVLNNCRLPKVCWYFDKIWNERPFWMHQVVPRTTLTFMTDETWAKRSGYSNIRILRQGIGDRDISQGTPDPVKYSAKIAFTGAVYGERRQWVKELEKRYPGQFQAYGNVFNRDLYDLCATVPIIVAPPFPSDEYYWSSRIYITLGSGGFLVHPRLAGLSAEYQDGEHYIGYDSQADLFSQVDYYLAHPKEREQIRQAGYKKTIKDFTYTKRVESLLKELVPYLRLDSKKLVGLK